MTNIFRHVVKKIPGARRYYLKNLYNRYLNKLRKQVPIGNGKKILIINHHFDQDIDALTNGCSNYCQFFVVDCMPFFNQALLFFKTDEERDGIIPYDKLPRAIVTGYRKLCAKLFADLHGVFPFEMIIMPSDSFWWVREFLEVARDHGVTRVVLDKEGTISPYSFEKHSAQIREKFPFMSDNLLVWSERQKQFWIKSGAPEECIKIVGQPRSDFFFQKNRWLSREALKLNEFRKHVLYFTFDIDAYINVFPAEEIEREGYSWLPLRNEINDVLLDFAKQHDDVCITIKVHPQQADIGFMRDFVEGLNLPNIRLAEGAAISNQLIVNSDLIIGFQTTALIESMLIHTPIFYTGWGQTEQKVRNHLIPFHESSGIEKIGSKADLMCKLEMWIKGDSVGGELSERKAFTDIWLNADGNVSSRIAEILKMVG